jgi:flagellar export protein FliJ
MKAYRFRLETVLRVRHSQEAVARSVLVAANRAESEADKMVLTRLAHYRELTEVPTVPTAVPATLANRQQANFATAALVDAGAILRQAKQATGAARDGYLAAARRVSILERLDGRRRDEHRMAAEHLEATEADDLVVGRHGRDTGR